MLGCDRWVGAEPQQPADPDATRAEAERATTARAEAEAQQAAAQRTADAAATRARAEQSYLELLNWVEEQQSAVSGEGSYTEGVAKQHGVKHELVQGIFDQLLEAAKKRARAEVPESDL